MPAASQFYDRSKQLADLEVKRLATAGRSSRREAVQNGPEWRWERLGGQADSEQRLGYWPLRNSVVGVSRFITNFLIKIMIKKRRFKPRPILYNKHNTNYVET